MEIQKTLNFEVKIALLSYLKPLSYFVKKQNSALKKKIAEMKSPYLSIFGVEFEKNYCDI